MEIVVSRNASARLHAPDAFGRFAVVVGPGVRPDLPRALKGITRTEGGPHAWVFPVAVRKLVSRAHDQGWHDAFDAMPASAVGRRLASDSPMRTHIEVREA